MPFGPALPNGVRTPSTKTTSRSERDMKPPQQWDPARETGAAALKLPVGNQLAKWVVVPGGSLRRRVSVAEAAVVVEQPHPAEADPAPGDRLDGRRAEGET